MFKRLMVVLGVWSLFAMSAWGAKRELQAGDQAPGFKMQDDTALWRTLEEFRGKKVVLYFYSKDDTTKSVQEACSFRSHAPAYAAKDIVVLGVSYDSPESHAAFKEKYQLPYTLLSDTTTKVAKLYGAYGKFPLLNRWFARRRTFLINEYGTIVRILDNVEVMTHGEDVLREFESTVQR